VSTGSQSLDGQLATLKAAGAATIYRETISGARSDRPQLQRLLVRLTPGDTLLVTRLDRLARSTRDLLNVLDTVAMAGASFRSLGDAWCDTTTPHGRLMLTVLGGLAEFELASRWRRPRRASAKGSNRF
jgi:DNA invertase Pin-like site-specific DNA recombinase